MSLLPAMIVKMKQRNPRYPDNAPADLHRYVNGYAGLDRDWQPQPTAA